MPQIMWDSQRQYTRQVFQALSEGTAAAYGFTTVAMVIPAIDEFDVATGRTTIGEQ